MAGLAGSSSAHRSPCVCFGCSYPTSLCRTSATSLSSSVRPGVSSHGCSSSCVTCELGFSFVCFSSKCIFRSPFVHCRFCQALLVGVAFPLLGQWSLISGGRFTPVASCLFPCLCWWLLILLPGAAQVLGTGGFARFLGYVLRSAGGVRSRLVFAALQLQAHQLSCFFRRSLAVSRLPEFGAFWQHAWTHVCCTATSAPQPPQPPQQPAFDSRLPVVWRLVGRT